MKSRWIVGGGDYLEQAFQAWKEARPEEAVEKIEVPQGAGYAFDLDVLNVLDPAEGVMFVAFDERFGNFKRTELMQAVMGRGFKLDPFISPSAIVATNAVIGPNAFIGAGVCMGGGVRVDYNTVVHAGAMLGHGARLRASCWLDMGVVVGNGAEIGAHSTLRTGAIVAPTIKVGRNCELGWPRRYDEDLPSRTIFDSRYDEPIYVYGT
jgi:UDP-3-O-[3-hydroxymyristoyl] glucosamine N-acyltransferase